MPNPSLIAAEMTDEEYERVVPEVALSWDAFWASLEAYRTQETTGLTSDAFQSKLEASR